MLETKVRKEVNYFIVTKPQNSFISLKQEYDRKRLQIQPQISMIMEWDLSRVRERLINIEKLDPADVDARILEYRRFLCLRLLSDKVIPVSQPVDVIWHTHVLFTKDYIKMGESVFGSYCHHNPTVNELEKKALSLEYISNTIPTYRVMFGRPNKKYWPMNSQCCDYDIDCAPEPNLPKESSVN